MSKDVLRIIHPEARALTYFTHLKNHKKSKRLILWILLNYELLQLGLTRVCCDALLLQNDKRERVVKASRDITSNSKKVIFQVHR